jgi:hypothetical protein
MTGNNEAWERLFGGSGESEKRSVRIKVAGNCAIGTGSKEKP